MNWVLLWFVNELSFFQLSIAEVQKQKCPITCYLYLNSVRKTRHSDVLINPKQIPYKPTHIPL